MQAFAAGTAILTPDGPRPVGRLLPGDRVLGPGDTLRRVQWVQSISLPAADIVCLKAGSLGPDLPLRDLVLGATTRVIPGPGQPGVPADDLCQPKADEQGTAEMIQLELDIPGPVMAAGVAAGGPPPAEPSQATRLAEVEAVAALRRRTGPAPGPLQGNLDRCNHGLAGGWAFDPSQPDLPVPLIVLNNGQRVAGAIARSFRADLLAARLGNGAVAFRVTFDPPLPNDRPNLLQVRRATDLMPLPGSPLLLEPEPAAATPVAAYPEMSPDERARLIGLLQAQIEALRVA
jgi:hypothetical protein